MRMFGVVGLEAPARCRQPVRVPGQAQRRTRPAGSGDPDADDRGYREEGCGHTGPPRPRPVHRRREPMGEEIADLRPGVGPRTE